MAPEDEARTANHGELLDLPPEVREHVVWGRCERQAQLVELGQRVVQRRRRVILQHLAIFAAAMAYGSGFELGATLLGALGGAGLGWVICALSAGELLSLAIAMPTYYVVMWISGRVSVPWFLCSSVLVAVAVMVAGWSRFDREHGVC